MTMFKDQYAGSATFFVDGRLTAMCDFKKDKTADIPLNLPAGEYLLAVFVAHAGRIKLAGYSRRIDNLDMQKVLRGPVQASTVTDSGVIIGWKMSGMSDPDPRIYYRLQQADEQDRASLVLDLSFTAIVFASSVDKTQPNFFETKNLLNHHL